MKLNLKVLTGSLALGMVAYAAYAENVTISTYYPSPYGSYQDLEVTRNAWFSSASGNTGVGLANTVTPVSKFQVNGTATIGGGAAAGTAGNLQLVPAAAGRLTFGSSGGGTSLSIADNNGGAVTDRLTVNSSGNVGIATAAPSYNLHVNGNAYVSGNMRLQAGGQQGNLQVSCDGTNCYAVYA